MTPFLSAEYMWPPVADQAPMTDVAICHHVAYNVPDLAPFVRRLTDHARQRVVLELPVAHPMSALNPLWLQFHGVIRPTTPTSDDALAVLREVGLAPRDERWEAPSLGWGGTFARRDELVGWVRRLLCLPSSHDAAIAAALEARLVERDGAWSLPPQPVVTVWWDGRGL